MYLFQPSRRALESILEYREPVRHEPPESSPRAIEGALVLEEESLAAPDASAWIDQRAVNDNRRSLRGFTDEGHPYSPWMTHSGVSKTSPTLGAASMLPLATERVDDAGVEIVSRWIGSLPE